MSSKVSISLLPRTEINGSYLGNAQTQTITLPTIPVVPYYYSTLVVRVHEATWSSGAYFRVDGYASYPTREDARPFVMGASRISATIAQSAASPPLVEMGTDSNLPVAYKFEATLGMSTSAASLFVVVSADLLLRSLTEQNDRAKTSVGVDGACGCRGKPHNLAPVGEIGISPIHGLARDCPYYKDNYAGFESCFLGLAMNCSAAGMGPPTCSLTSDGKYECKCD